MLVTAVVTGIATGYLVMALALVVLALPFALLTRTTGCRPGPRGPRTG